MRRSHLVIVCAVAALSASSAALADSVAELYQPDMTEAFFAEPLEASVPEATSLPEALMFSGDAMDVEHVTADGAGVYVAVLDTGLLPAATFFFSQANVAWELGKGFSHDVTWDAAAGDFVFGPLRDDRGYWTQYASGHGTHVASSVVGFNRNNQLWVRGVAPEATLIPVLVLDGWLVDTPDGQIGITGGTDEMVAAGIEYVADLAETLDGPVVINMSLGGPARSTIIEAAVDRAIANGVVVVASAGNEGETGMGYPGGLPQIISSGAAGWATMFLEGWYGDVPEKLNQTDELGNPRQLYLEDFSSRPNKDLDQKHQDLDVSAPGAWLYGPYKPAFSPVIAYYYLSGTSMASPHVAGTAALVLGMFPGFVQDEMEKILELAATGMPLPACDALVAFPYSSPPNYTATWDGGDYGKGFVRIPAALHAASKRAPKEPKEPKAQPPKGD